MTFAFSDRIALDCIAPNLAFLSGLNFPKIRDMWDSFSDLLDAVKEVEEGRLHGTSIQTIVAIARTIVEQMRGHIKRENTILYPALKELMTEQESSALLDGIQHAR